MATANMDLSGIRILITRPAHQSGGWRDLLVAEGALADTIPLLDIEPIDQGDRAQAIKSLILDFDQFDHAIFVSQNAVQHGFDWLDNYWPQLPQGPRYYAIGAATARALRARGAVPEAGNTGEEGETGKSTMDSEALLALPSLLQPQGERVILFRGQGGRPLIGSALEERGARVDYCELYQRTLPGDATEQVRTYGHTPDAITVHSGETLDNLHRVIETSARDSLRHAVLICPSERVASHARALGFPRVHAAVNAGDGAMLAALKDALAADHS
ncbi:uroporphyrinogen-III synthase [uncultured Microbulbifer sp.]|uniref:uroporphyrinogen-III synthase n=1 Tax=uncultured Microbulbifer sp. TaxID=348147 RepID=UPI00260B3E18|nr:uroporphyrinogen-III synthase [uncultured Microbulbifer sp.]